MMEAIDFWIVPGLQFLAEWSARWALVLLVLALWFILRPPQRTATRHLLCLIALATGLLLPVIPRWQVEIATRPKANPSMVAADQPLADESLLPKPGAVLSRPRSNVVVRPLEPRLGGEERRSQPAPVPIGVRRLLALGIAAIWAVVAILLSARLVGGRLFLAKLKAQAVPCGEASGRLLIECQQSLGLSRLARLAMHPATTSPVVIGGRVPVILVPPDWDGWPEAHRRDCLRHELAHLQRRDDWAKFIQELVLVPFFFHPLVRWLLKRLDRERELLCDETVVALGGDPLVYARLLLDLARRPGQRLIATAALRPGWLPFFDRGTVAVRIERLLEDDMMRSLSPPSPRRLFAMGTVALATALGISSLQVRAVETPTKQDKPTEQQEAVPKGDGSFTAKLSAKDTPLKGVEAPREVAEDELAGVVVDAQGKPIEGVEAHAWHWVPGRVTRTDRDGRFRITKLNKGDKVEIRFRKEGYETQYHLDKATGQPDWVVVLGNTTFFEGRVLAPDGSPASDVIIQADSGPKRASGFMLSECYTETKSGKDGRYRLYVEPGQYDIKVRSPGVGVAGLSKEVIAANQIRQQDIRLEPGINVVARTVDHETGKPVAGVSLSHWQKPGIEGTSDADGRIEIRDVPPGTYPRFQVEAKGYTRWWSNACLSEWSRFQKDAGRGFQRNFDGLDFLIEPGMKDITIELERGATVRGRVLDPDGKPVAGATVAPALTGTGNSLTGDTRFSVPTDDEGRFTMLLPASGPCDYNLVAHDGKYGQWRTWANGVLPPFRTTPGEEISDVELRLTRPATVHGRVTDLEDKPVANREVRASAADLLENRYYDPTTKTNKDGIFELKYVRSGRQFIQVAPFWLPANDAPAGTSQELKLEPGESKEEINFQIQVQDRNN